MPAKKPHAAPSVTTTVTDFISPIRRTAQLMKPLSKRKLKSYQRAEAVAQEMRYALAHRRYDEQRVFKLVESWMKVTGSNVCYSRPGEVRRGSKTETVPTD